MKSDKSPVTGQNVKAIAKAMVKKAKEPSHLEWLKENGVFNTLPRKKQDALDGGRASAAQIRRTM